MVQLNAIDIRTDGVLLITALLNASLFDTERVIAGNNIDARRAVLLTVIDIESERTRQLVVVFVFDAHKVTKLVVAMGIDTKITLLKADHD